MAHIAADIDIEATPQQILDVLADLPAYPHWSAVHKTAHIDARYPDGRPSRATMAVAAVGLADRQVIDYKWTDSRVSWSLVKAVQQRDQHGSYSIKPGRNGNSHVHYALDIAPAIPLPEFVVRRVMRKAVTAATEGLKHEVESRR
jgi:hypothetical protein